ncbi:MAG: hypothetical protein JKY53_02670 [Flavobacteriales bacterium]|nr:hypothetical protein [Flavobacteriales bacterium]
MAKKTSKNKSIKDITKSTDFFDKADSFFSKRSTIWLVVSLACTALFGLLIFDMKVSVGGDDSAYILRAFRFIKDGMFPAFQAPLYPIVMSLIIGVIGIKLTVLKMLSLMFLIVNIYFFYRAFKDSAPPSVFFPVLLLTGLNHFLLYYGSQTYSEAMFIAVQSITFFVVFKSFFNKPLEDSEIDIRQHYKLFLVAGLWMFIMFLTRKIGGGFLLALLGYFLLHKKWKHFLYSGIGFGAWFALYMLVKLIFWGEKLLNVGAQENRILLKDPYNKSKGYEDLAGFFDRFIGNSQLYLSKHFLKFIGLKDEMSITKSGLVATLIYLVFAVSVVYVYRKNKQILLTLIYLAIMLGLTFILLATKWDQGRLVIVYAPLALLSLLTGLYYLFKTSFLKKFQAIFVVLVLCLFIPAFTGTTNKVKGKLMNLRHNLSGDMYHGYSPDWENYLKMCVWAAENVSEDVMIAARKPSMAFIYSGGRRFHGIYRLPSQDPDTLFNKLKENNVRYVIMASLRRTQK